MKKLLSRNRKPQSSPEFLRMALAGYELEAERLTREIDRIQSEIKTRKTVGSKSNRMSKAGRAAIAAAQKRRWAKTRKLTRKTVRPRVKATRAKPNDAT